MPAVAVTNLLSEVQTTSNLASHSHQPRRPGCARYASYLSYIILPSAHVPVAAHVVNVAIVNTVVVPVRAAQTVTVDTPLPSPLPPEILLTATPHAPSIVLATEPSNSHVPAQSTLMAMQPGYVSQIVIHCGVVTPVLACRLTLAAVDVLFVRNSTVPVYVPLQSIV